MDYRPEMLPWPPEWRKDEQRTRTYMAKGSEGIRVVDVDFEGIPESGLLVPFHRASRWLGILFLLLGALFTGLVGAGVVTAVLNREWMPVLGALCLGVLAGLFLFGGYAQLAQPRSSEPGLRLTPTRLIGPSFAIPWNEITTIRPFLANPESGSLVKVVDVWSNSFSVEVRDPDAVLPAKFARVTGRLMRRAFGSGVLIVDDKQLAVHPLVAYHLIRHHLENPADRPNITTAMGSTI
ncbi:hypothetical protein ACFVMC_23675 [Nocardia sp. NPDC127579]|uniref:hypothetical protein n=1 Tax=Nocardia sp. NPDC127579 TaxID=3345402 RepID=UPI00362DA0F5